MSSIYILDTNYDLLISREYKYEIDPIFITQLFKTLIRENESKGLVNLPVLYHQGINFVYFRYDEIIMLTITVNNSNSNIMLLMSFLMKFTKLLKDYFITFGVFSSNDLVNRSNLNSSSGSNLSQNNSSSKGGHMRQASADHSDGRTSRIDETLYSINADLIKDNYILIYELFDETIDFGIPQITEFNILREYINSVNKSSLQNIEVNENDLDEYAKEDAKDQVRLINSSVSRASTNNISWRIKGIFYNKNEFFINFIENIKFHYNLEADKIMTNLIIGEVDCISYLSGMPTLKLGLNESLNRDNSMTCASLSSDNININDSNENNNANNTDTLKQPNTIFDNINFHQCVELNRLSTSIFFIPPDGNFQLLNYQIFKSNADILKPLLLIDPLYKIYKSKSKNAYRLRISIDLITYFKRKYTMDDVKVVVPLIIKQIYRAEKDSSKLNASNTLVVNYNKPGKFKTKLGEVILNLDKKSVDWHIPQLDSNVSSTDLRMTCEFELITQAELFKIHDSNMYHHKQDQNDLIYFELGKDFEAINSVKQISSSSKMSISAQFQLNEITYSGLQVEYLTIKDPLLKYQSFPWVRYITKCDNEDDYTFRLSWNKNFINRLTEADFPEDTVEEQEKPDTTFLPVTESDVNLHTNFKNRRLSHAQSVRSYEEYMVEGEDLVDKEVQEMIDHEDQDQQQVDPENSEQSNLENQEQEHGNELNYGTQVESKPHNQ